MAKKSTATKRKTIREHWISFVCNRCNRRRATSVAICPHCKSPEFRKYDPADILNRGFAVMHQDYYCPDACGFRKIEGEEVKTETAGPIGTTQPDPLNDFQFDEICGCSECGITFTIHRKVPDGDPLRQPAG